MSNDWLSTGDRNEVRYSKCTCNACDGKGVVSPIQQDGLLFGLVDYVLWSTKVNCRSCGGRGTWIEREYY